MKIRLYWEFYKSTLLVNWTFSFTCAIVKFSHFSVVLSVATMTVGPFLSFFYKEVSKKKEYYFYYNRGISKVDLLVSTTVFNALMATVIYILLSNARFA